MPLSATECHGVPLSATECHGVPLFAVRYAEAVQCWLTTVAPPLRVPPDSRVLADVLQLLINQGESLCERRTHLLALMT